MNQQNNQFNTNNLNTQNNNGMIHNQSLHNNQDIVLNQQTLNNTFENVNVCNQNINNNQKKKVNIGLIIGILAVLSIIAVIKLTALFKNNKNNNFNSNNIFTIYDVFDNSHSVDINVENLDEYEYFGKLKWESNFTNKKYIINIPFIKTTMGSNIGSLVSGCGENFCMSATLCTNDSLMDNEYNRVRTTGRIYDNNVIYAISTYRATNGNESTVIGLIYKDIQNKVDSSDISLYIEVTLFGYESAQEKQHLREFSKLYGVNYEKLEQIILNYFQEGED